MEWLLIAAAMFVAFSNGANDNFKGFATVWGSETLDYQQALRLATIATIAGSLVSWLLAASLVQQFSGKGLVPDNVVSSLPFISSVACSAAITVFLATRFGFPISTTHALIGGLIGAGLAQGNGVHFSRLTDTFLVPLLLSPLIAAILGALAYRLLRLRDSQKDCACITAPAVVTTVSGNSLAIHALSARSISTHSIATHSISVPRLLIASDNDCDQLTNTARFSISHYLDRLHIGSAMAICFARSVNDTPKLLALLLAAQVFHSTLLSILLITLAMAAGGLLFARKVAHTMSRRVTRLDHSSGLAANLITALMVLLASKSGVPVSTTHVAVGTIIGVGMSSQTLDWQALRSVLLSWIVTLPLAAALALGIAHLF